MSENNPFLAREASSGGFTPAGRAVDGGRGLEWLKEGWQLFMRNPGIWIAIAIIMLVISVALNIIPLIGGLIAALIYPVFTAGLLLGCKSLSENGELRIDHLFAGFKEKTGNLMVIGALFLVGSAAIMLIVMMFVGGGAMTGAMMGDGAGLGMAMGAFLISGLVGLALTVPVAMAIWFAPALVVFRDVAPVDAMKASFGACLKNMVPFLVYGVVLFVLMIIAMIPFMLGFLVLIPVTMGSVYSAYVDIFE